MIDSMKEVTMEKINIFKRDVHYFKLPLEDCNEISEWVYKAKNTWKRDLNNVKALTSGFNPDCKFIKRLNEIYARDVLPKIENASWESTWSWINFYSRGNYTLPHQHRPEDYSSIITIKRGNNHHKLCWHNDDHKEIYNNDNLEETGMCLIFSSDLNHSVRIVDDDRITISLDFIRKKNEL
tara:strand:- start:1123 stop:1665 length:543 start_codon:yes stop_codon:yes gene_type:complete